jgi:predicted O-methyltransferase YrrM
VQPRPSGRDFDAVYELVAPLPGWLTRDQARTLHDAAAAVPSGTAVVEVGSHHGRSTVVLASAAPAGTRVVAVDPFPDDWRYGAAGTEDACRANLAAAGIADRVDLRVATSDHVRGAWDGPVGLVYVDGKHDFWSARSDLRWSAHVVDGGWVLVHDAFSSLGVTTALLRELATSRTLRYHGRVGSLARLQVSRPAARDRLLVLRELPWWARNLVVKVLLRARCGRLARLLGHEGSADPY